MLLNIDNKNNNNNNKKRKVFLHITLLSDASCDTEDWSNGC